MNELLLWRKITTLSPTQHTFLPIKILYRRSGVKRGEQVTHVEKEESGHQKYLPVMLSHRVQSLQQGLGEQQEPWENASPQCDVHSAVSRKRRYGEITNLLLQKRG